ncbi:hypothetical protein EON66_07540 [archaeon]|nr:MAG: hypothetical protein EON66_07540 [archaeon]
MKCLNCSSYDTAPKFMVVYLHKIAAAMLVPARPGGASLRCRAHQVALPQVYRATTSCKLQFTL